MRAPSASAKAALESATPSYVYLVELQLPDPVGTLRYALFGVDVTHRSVAWTKTAGGFTEIQESTQREVPQPRLVLQNLDGVLGPKFDRDVSGYVDPRGSRVVIYTVEASKLGAVNADVADTFVIEDFKTSPEAVAFTLGNPMAVALRVPHRTTNPYGCAWRFASKECGAIPGVTTTFTTCARTLEECRARWPGQPLPYGGFPGVTQRRLAI